MLDIFLNLVNESQKIANSRSIFKWIKLNLLTERTIKKMINKIDKEEYSASDIMEVIMMVNTASTMYPDMTMPGICNMGMYKKMPNADFPVIGYVSTSSYETDIEVSVIFTNSFDESGEIKANYSVSREYDNYKGENESILRFQKSMTSIQKNSSEEVSSHLFIMMNAILNLYIHVVADTVAENIKKKKGWK